VPRSLSEIAQTAKEDAILAGKCYRLRHLKLHLPVIDSNVYMTKTANKGRVSETAYRRVLQMLSILKDNLISHGKNPNAFAVAVLYAAYLEEGKKICQTQIALVGDISIATTRNRFQDVRKIFP
jgi:transcription initiation factor TFIIIB Brf1 subunit/transcription initiation factor TFIIB